MKIKNNKWAAVAGFAQWVTSVWCVQIAFAHSIPELMVPAALALVSGSITILGFLKLEGENEQIEEMLSERYVN